MKTRAIAVLAATLLVLTASQTSFAREASEEGAPAEDPDASELEADESESDDAEQTSPDEGDADGDEDDDSERAESEGDEEEDEAAKGPGGRELRDDYPGTEESKKSRMESDRIEGLDFEEDDPDDGYDVRIRELETKVDDLKEKVFSSKSRIVLLKETVLSGNVSGSRAIISHENDLGGAYKVRRAHYSLDGSRVYNEANTDELDTKDPIEVFSGSVSPGNHRVSIMLELQGTGYGIFNYMDDYKFTIKDSCEFKAQEGRSAVVDVRLIDRGGSFSSYEERPGVECVFNSVDLSQDELQAAGSNGAAEGENGSASN